MAASAVAEGGASTANSSIAKPNRIAEGIVSTNHWLFQIFGDLFETQARRPVWVLAQRAAANVFAHVGESA